MSNENDDARLQSARQEFEEARERYQQARQQERELRQQEREREREAHRGSATGPTRSGAAWAKRSGAACTRPWAEISGTTSAGASATP